jgi:hypothetical protein
MSLLFGPIGKNDDSQEDQEYRALVKANSDLIRERAALLEQGNQTIDVQKRLQEIDELRAKIRSVMDAMG